MQNDTERKQPQNVNFEQYATQINNVIGTLEEAPTSPKVTQAIQKLRQMNEELRAAKAA